MLVTSLSLGTFTSCGDDDDDDKAKLELTGSVNGDSLVNKEAYVLAKGTIDPSEEGSDTVTLKLSANCNINSIVLTVNNDYESNVDVIDVNGEAYGSKTTPAIESTDATIKFIGVYGTYTVLVKSENGNKTYTFSLKNETKHSDYKSSTRILSNTQVLKFDSEAVIYPSKIFGITLKLINSNNGYKLNESLFSEISEEDYETYKGYSISTLANEVKGLEYSNYNLKGIDVPSYLVYKKSSSVYCLLKIVENNGNLVTMEVNY